MNTICKIKELYRHLFLFEKEFQKINNLTLNEAMVLCCLKEKTGKPANAICKFIGLSGSRVSRIIQSVEEKGYISRKMGVDDKRQMIFELSPKGVKKLASLKEVNQSLTKFLKVKTL